MAQNGQLPTSSLVALSTPGFLLAPAAASFERLRLDAKTTGTEHPNEAYRDYETQVEVFKRNYTTTYTQYAPGKTDVRRWQGKDWYRKKGGVSAAVPGTSNHGWGNTVDWQNLGGFDSATWKAFAKKAIEHGWDNDEGRAVGEPWHWTYNATNDKHINDGQPVKDKVTTLEDPMLKHRTSARSSSQKVVKDKWVTLKVNNEGHVSTACSQADIYTAVGWFVVKGLPVGATIQIRAYVVDYLNGSNGKRVKNLAIMEAVGTSGSTFVLGVWSGQGLKRDASKGYTRRILFEALTFSSGVEVSSLTINADMWNDK